VQTKDEKETDQTGLEMSSNSKKANLTGGERGGCSGRGEKKKVARTKRTWEGVLPLRETNRDKSGGSAYIGSEGMKRKNMSRGGVARRKFLRKFRRHILYGGCAKGLVPGGRGEGLPWKGGGRRQSGWKVFHFSESRRTGLSRRE